MHAYLAQDRKVNSMRSAKLKTHPSAMKCDLIFSPHVFGLLLNIFIATSVNAEVLSPLALFNRCYTQLTLLPLPPKDNALVAAVIAGTRQPADACIDVVEEALLTAVNNTVIGDVNNLTARAVIGNFHSLHSSWFSVDDFPLIEDELRNHGTKNIWDASAPAIYVTRALLHPTGQARSIVTESVNLRPRRANMNVTVSIIGDVPLSDATNIRNTIFRADPNFRYAGIGPVLGVQPTGPLMTNYSYKFFDPGADQIYTGAVALGATVGGGLLGTAPYLMKTVREALNFRANGGDRMPRKWAKAIYNDLLCRELPVARLADSMPYAVADGPGVAPFRTSASCTRCHVSIDQMAGVIRGFSYESLGLATGAHIVGLGGDFVKFVPPTQPSAGGRWPATSDVNYHLRPSTGSLFFRSYNGTLIDRPVSSVANLGAALAATDDFYICLASRYYRYFTGVTVNLSDLSDPKAPIILTARAAAHRSTVVNLGLQLKSHQNLRRTVEDIIKLPIYRESDLGL